MTKGTQYAIVSAMDNFDWDDEKNRLLEKTRGVNFEEVVFHIQNGDILDIVPHPNPSRYPQQRVIVLNVEGYAYLVPFVEREEKWFLKTIIPSRKATKEYLT